jgi:uncharacterized protein YegP (UPF0339 family)
MKIHIFRGKKGQWYWHMKAANGKVVCHGEGYKRKESLLDTLKVLKLSFQDALVVFD